MLGLRQGEHAFYDGLVRTGADVVCVSSSAQEKADGVDDDGLASAGFSGQGIETGRWLELQMLYDGEVADGQVGKQICLP